MVGNSVESSRVFLRRLLMAVFVIAATFGEQGASAQVLYGSLVGTVTDPNGAVVPGASVLATNQDTGVSKTATTDSAGGY